MNLRSFTCLAAALAAMTLVLVGLASAPVASGRSSREAEAVERALANIRANPKVAHARSDQAFAARDVIIDANGNENVRFDRTYQGLRVVGGDLVVHEQDTGTLLGVSQTLADDLTLGTKPVLSSEDAARDAAAVFAGSPASSKAELVVYALGKPTLAWEVVVSGDKPDGSPSELHVFVDALSGKVLNSWDGIENAKGVGQGTGQGFFNGKVALTTTPISGGWFSLTDPTRGNLSTIDMKNGLGNQATLFTDANDKWGDGTLTNDQTIAVDAQYGAAETWDYYKNVLGRNGIANDGVGSVSRVHYGQNFNNAYWDDGCFCMTYGDGDGVTFNPFDALDVAGHEMSHGVTSRTANLDYSGESGGLNEGTSDIFGTMVEFYANNKNDPGDYLMGEELFKSGNGAFRYMYHPSLGGSADCWYPSVGGLDVHASSGVANHFFYLLAEGTKSTYGASPTCQAGDEIVATESRTLLGIGRAAAERIWYRALTVYMTSGTDFQGARTATLNAAQDLFGAGSAQQAAVAAAWSAVNVNGPVEFQAPAEVAGSGTAGSLTYTATSEYAGGLTYAIRGLQAAVKFDNHVGGDAACSFDTTNPDANVAAGFATVNSFVTPLGASYIRFQTFASDVGAAAHDLDMYVYRAPAGSSSYTLIASSGGPDPSEVVNATSGASLAGAQFKVYVHGCSVDAGGADFTLFAWALTGSSSNPFSTVPASQAVTVGQDVPTTFGWSGLPAGNRYLGRVTALDPAAPIPAMANTVIEVSTR
jgi:Zn-dependent metalloprotease